jgi:hypothetical protein
MQSLRLWRRCDHGYGLVLFDATRFRGNSCNQGTNVRPHSSVSAAQTSIITKKERLTTIRLYRILHRACRSFPAQDTAANAPALLLQPTLNPFDWGRHVVFKPPSSTMVEELFRFFYVLNDEADNGANVGGPSSIDDWYCNVVGRNDIEAQLPPMTSMTCWTSTGQIQEAIRKAFRTSFDDDNNKLSDLHFWAIRAVQLLHEQQVLWRNSSVATTNGVRVTATSQ